MSTSGSVIVWEWEYRPHVWVPYTPSVCQFIENEYRRSMASGKVDLSRQNVKELAGCEVHFASMKQVNVYANESVKVRRYQYPSTCPFAKGIIWKWFSDFKWQLYDVATSNYIEEAFQKKSTKVDLRRSPVRIPNVIHFASMKQVNKRTKFSRDIQREETQTQYPHANHETVNMAGVGHPMVGHDGSSTVTQKITVMQPNAVNVNPAYNVHTPVIQHGRLNGIRNQAMPTAGSNSMHANIHSPVNQHGGVSGNLNQATSSTTSNTIYGNTHSPVNQHGGVNARTQAMFSTNSNTAGQSSGLLNLPHNQPISAFGSNAMPGHMNSTSRLGLNPFSNQLTPRSTIFNPTTPFGVLNQAYSRANNTTTLPCHAPSCMYPQSSNTGGKSQASSIPVAVSNQLVLGSANGANALSPTPHATRTIGGPLANFTRSVPNGVEPDDECAICLENLSTPSEYDDNPTADVQCVSADIVQLLQCKHMFHRICLQRLYDSGTKNGCLRCPTCKTIHGVLKGNQPDGGTMRVTTNNNDIPGYPGHGSIVIVYSFTSGLQGPDHPNPGQLYHANAFPRTCYLPNNPKGKKVLKLLQTAFDRRLVFTVGRSVTTGLENTVVWNDIHHKTEGYGNHSGYGYPDPNYLDNVLGELAAHGVTDDT